MTHLFIVNCKTFKVHLEYLFAGTGASDVSTDFIFDSSIKIHTQDEKRSIGMITDVSRIRKGDKIIFFVTGISKFYGIFEAASELFIDPNDDNNYLYNELGKILTYRILIKPFKVFEKGLSEYDFLDSLEGLNYPDEICWSLIYRKLGGNRGCTMITDQEFELFQKRISVNNTILNSNYYSFNESARIIVPCEIAHEYCGRQNISFFKSLKQNAITKYKNKKAFEHYIQYFCINSLKTPNCCLLQPNLPLVWIGNEVMCSVGEHRIDALAIQESNDFIHITLIEMKDEKINDYIYWQIYNYLKWIKDYITPYYLRKKKKILIHPLVLSDGIPNASQKLKDKLLKLETAISNRGWNISVSSNIKIEKIKIIHFNDIFQFLN